MIGPKIKSMEKVKSFREEALTRGGTPEIVEEPLDTGEESVR